MLVLMVILSISSAHMALSSHCVYTCYYRGPCVTMCPRDDDGAAHFDDKDLFDSCPGGPGSAKLVHADRCTLVGDIRCSCSIDLRRTIHKAELAHRSTSRASTPVSGSSSATFSASTSRVPRLLLSTVLTLIHPEYYSCGGSEDEVTVTIGGEQTVSQTTTLNANVAFSLGPVQIGGGISQSWTESTTVSKSIEYAIRPGRQAVYVAGVVHSNETGIVQVNYGDRQYGHYIVSTLAITLFVWVTC